MERKTFKFRDLDSKRVYSLKAFSPDEAIESLNKKAKKRVNYSFLGFGRSNFVFDEREGHKTRFTHRTSKGAIWGR